MYKYVQICTNMFQNVQISDMECAQMSLKLSIRSIWWWEMFTSPLNERNFERLMWTSKSERVPYAAWIYLGAHHHHRYWLKIFFFYACAQTNGGDQATQVASLLEGMPGSPFENVRIVADLAGIPRHVTATKRQHSTLNTLSWSPKTFPFFIISSVLGGVVFLRWDFVAI